MKKLTYLLVSLVVMGSLPIQSAFAQKSQSQSLPKVPITYQGDTDQTIVRRTQWMEGAKKERELVWWGSVTPSDAAKISAEFNKIYPFIKVNFWRGTGEEVSAKLEAEYSGGHPTVNIALGGEPYHYPRWRKIGLLKNLPTLCLA